MLAGLLAGILLLLCSTASAQVLVLIPGLEEQQAQGFHTVGATTMLVRSGWVDGGFLIPSPEGVRFQIGREADRRVFYTLVMPTDREVAEQAEWLHRYADIILRRHADEPQYWVAHSIAGVVARYALVRRPRPSVAALATIATPHIDATMPNIDSLSWQAPLGGMPPRGMSPLSMATPLILTMQEMMRMFQLFFGFTQDQSFNVLHWLSLQPHPPLRYISIVRLQDTLVDPALQDMNDVLDLRGRVETLWSPGAHGLMASDGTLIAALFSRP